MVHWRDSLLFGPLATTKAVLPHFRANGGGVIVNISSIGGKMTFPLGSLSHGTQFAVEGLSEALSFELAAIGVKLKVVEPGMIKTDFGGRSFDFTNDESLVEYQDVVGKVFVSPLAESGSQPVVVAEVIHRAATDGTDQHRFTAGPDAAQLVAHRKAADDATFLGGIKAQFGLWASRAGGSEAGRLISMMDFDRQVVVNSGGVTGAGFDQKEGSPAARGTPGIIR